MTNPTINPMIPRINPAIAIPFESSVMIPIIPKTIARPGKMYGPQEKKNTKSQPTNSPSSPKINAKIPNTFPMFFTNLLFINFFRFMNI